MGYSFLDIYLTNGLKYCIYYTIITIFYFFFIYLFFEIKFLIFLQTFY